MIESNFKYTYGLLTQINKNATKSINLFSEIAMFVILVGAVVLFVVGNIITGLIFSAIFVLLLVGLIFTNKSIIRSNSMLHGQQVKLVFNNENMVMTTLMGDKKLNNATMEYKAIKKMVQKQDLIYVYFDKNMALVIPKSSFKTTADCEKAMQLASNNYIV